MKRIYCSCVVLTVLAGLAGCHANNKSAQQGAGRILIQSTEQARANTDRSFQLILEGKYSGAEPLLKEAIQYDPSYGPAHNNLGLVYFHLKSLYDAAWEFDKAAKLMLHQPEPRNNLGLVLEQAEQLKEAVAAYESAYQLAPDNPEYIGNLARAHIRLGDKDPQTLKLLQELVLRDTRPDWSNWARVNLLRLRGTILEQSNAVTQPIAPPQ